jgi:predicted RNA-binding protein YlqC (UPF0109 family)
MSENFGNELDSEYEDEFDDEDDNAGNRIDSGNGASGGTARAVLGYIVENIVDDPQSIVIDDEERRNGVMLRVHVAPDDLGRVIGRRGRVAQSIRAVVRAAGAKDGVETSVDIADD